MKTVQEIYEEMKAVFAEKAGFMPAEGCDAAVRLYALAAQVYALSVQTDWVLGQSFPQTARGKYLDSHALMRGLTRTAAVKAKGLLRFAAKDTAALTCTIPAGTVCMTAEGVRFETTERATLNAGESWVDVPAQAVEAGKGGNAVALSVTLMSLPPVGIAKCSNPAAFTGGAEAEDDESLRARILASYARLPNGANAAYYEEEALKFPEIAAAKAIGRARGIGTVDLYAATAEGAPSAELLAEIEAAIAKKREIGVDVRVLAPTTKTVNVSAAIAAEDFAAAKAKAEAAVRDFFTGEKLGRSVLTAQLLSRICGVEGVENCRISAPAADLAIAATELAVLGTLSITEME